MKTRARRLLRWIRPPRGREVRRLLAGLCLAIALPRLPLVQDVFYFSPLRFGPPEAYGFLFLLASAGLLLTMDGWRMEVRGRVAAAFTGVMFVTLAFASVSATSFLVDMLCAAAAFGEVVTMRDE